MKTHSQIDEFKLNETNIPNKQFSQIIDDIKKDYNDIREEDNNIFKWRTLEDTVICNAYNDFKVGRKLLSFDLDDTIIEFAKKKSGNSKSSNKNNEESLTFSFDINLIKYKLEEYQEKNYIFAIFSNQNGITLGHIKENEFKNKIDKIFKEELKYPFVVIFAKDKDYYRKPSPGMIDIFKKYFNQNLDFDLNECIYVGDAAGRKKSKTYKRNDFSDSDYKFALNCQFKFFTPEEFFLNIKSDYPKIFNNLHDYDKNNNDIKFNSSLDFEEVFMLISSPGSGKITYAENFLAP